MATVDLVPDDHLRGAGDVGPGAVVGPRRGVDAVLDRHAHQLVIGGVVVDAVDPVPVAVMGAQHRHVRVGLLAPELRLGRPGQATEGVQVVAGPGRALAPDSLHEHVVAAVDITLEERWRLVRHVVGGERIGVHGRSSDVGAAAAIVPHLVHLVLASAAGELLGTASVHIAPKASPKRERGQQRGVGQAVAAPTLAVGVKVTFMPS